MLYMECLAAGPPDSIEPGVATPQESIDSDVANGHNVIGRGLDNNSVGAGDEDGGNLSAATVKCNGFSDGDCAEPTWIQGVNFASGSSLGNSSGPGLAGSGAAARIGIIPNARNPGPGCLSIPKRGSQQNKSQQFQQIHFAHRCPLIRFSNTQVLPCRLTRPILSRQAGGVVNMVTRFDKSYHEKVFLQPRVWNSSRDRACSAHSGIS